MVRIINFSSTYLHNLHRGLIVKASFEANPQGVWKQVDVRKKFYITVLSMSQYLFLVGLPPNEWTHRIIIDIEKKGLGGVSWGQVRKKGILIESSNKRSSG
ncbi:MAG: hypothetical protein ACFFCW_32435 [Candidatus Hodarchaeota archaeon]